MTKDNLATALALCLVEIDGSGIDQGRTYKDKETGTTKPLPGQQTGYIWQGGKYPLKVSIPIPEGKPAYRPGSYLMSGEMFASGQYDRIEFKGTRNMQLISVADAAQALAEIASEESNVKPVKAA